MEPQRGAQKKPEKKQPPKQTQTTKQTKRVNSEIIAFWKKFKYDSLEYMYLNFIMHDKNSK